MSATNATTNYELPVFIATDKPAWLVDWNGAMNAIDAAIKEAKTAGDNAQSTANTNANNIQTLDGTVTSQGTAIGNLQTAVSGNTGSINTINSLIGNGEPTTTDKTIIGAINEINAQVGGTVEADDVVFDPTGTSLVATNVEDAIKEVASASPASVDADDVTYDNTTSGLSATNVQDAIDELASAGPTPVGSEHGIFELWANSDITQNFANQDVALTNFDSTKYDAIVIAFETDTSESKGSKWVEFDKAVLSITSYVGTPGEFRFYGANRDALCYVSRTVEFALSGTTLTITFGEGKQALISTYGSAPTDATNNGYMIPVRILGLVHNA